jgi:transcriptional regulator with XRE-family HTH domain
MKRSLSYREIFIRNAQRCLDERGVTKQVVSKKAGVSVSFFCDITSGKGNPSLRTMEAIANALALPLSLVLETGDEVSLGRHTLKEQVNASDR